MYTKKDLDEKIHLITYGSNYYTKSAIRLKNQAESFYEFESITNYGIKDLGENFINSVNEIIRAPRGGGYWIWKPYLIQKKLEEIEDGEYLIYLDAGCTINPLGFERFKEYIQILKESDKPIIGFQLTTFLEKFYTTDKIFDYFNVVSDSPIRESGQLIGGIQIMRKCKFTVSLFRKINNVINDNPYLFTDIYNKETKRQGFVDNRHDQSVISVAKKIEGCVIIEDESYYTSFGCDKSLEIPFWATRVKSL